MKQGEELDQKYSLVLVCAGSNVTSTWGNPRETIQKSAEQLSVVFETKIESSAIYRTPAFPAGSGADFANAAFAFQTDQTAPQVLNNLHQIEALADRRRDKRWAARTLDLDLIALGDEIAPNRDGWQHWADLSLKEQQNLAPDQLILPHPRVQDRAFALIPLTDVAPDWCHPILNQTIQQLSSVLSQASKDEVKPY